MAEAIDFLARGIEKGVWTKSGRLPTTIDLARQAGVSPASMTKAIRALVDEGRLSARRGKGIVLGSRSGRLEQTMAPMTKTETVATNLVRDIMVGTYLPRHELPSIKELRAHHGVGYRTMKRVIGSLVRQGIVTPRNGGYGLRLPVPGVAVKTLVYIIDREREARLPVYSYSRSFFYPFLYALERECSHRNIRLIVEHYPPNLARLAHRRDAVAYLVSLDDEPTKQSWDLIARLLSFGTLVLVHRDGEHPGFSSFPPSSRLVLLECNNEAAGFQVGQFLIARGHERICYVNRAGVFGWSSARLAGMQRAFRSAGLPDAVREVRVPDSKGGWIDSSLRTRTTAWVACEDPLAVGAILPELARRSIVPGTDISVVGFNDQVEAFHSRLTSYNFNMDGLASAVLFQTQFAERESKRQRLVLLDGYIVDRGSVRALPSKSRD